MPLLLTFAGSDGPALIDPGTLSPVAAMGYRYGASPFYQDSGRTTIVTANGDPVGSATNFGSAGTHWKQATAGKRPTYVSNALNGYPGIATDGSDDYVVTDVSANYNMGTGCTVMIVLSSSPDTTFGRTVAMTAFSSGAADYNDGNAFDISIEAASAGTVRLERVALDGTNPGNMIYSGTGSASGIAGVYGFRIDETNGIIDGVARGFAGSDTYHQPGFFGPDRIWVGIGVDPGGPTFPAPFTIVDLLVFQGYMSNANYNSGLSFLRSFYGGVL